MDAGSLFSDLPDIPGIQQQKQKVEAPVDLKKTEKDGVQWVPGVGFVQKNTGNSGQEWAAAAGSPAPNLKAIQQHNNQLLDESAPFQSGPGTTPSTARYYTRKLARQMLGSRDPAVQQNARLALRFQGADSSQSGAQGLTDSAWWNSFFKKNENNNFGEGTGDHAGQELVKDSSGLRFKYLTDLS